MIYCIDIPDCVVMLQVLIKKQVEEYSRQKEEEARAQKLAELSSAATEREQQRKANMEIYMFQERVRHLQHLT